jgi:hypothetical protein
LPIAKNLHIKFDRRRLVGNVVKGALLCQAKTVSVRDGVVKGFSQLF